LGRRSARQGSNPAGSFSSEFAVENRSHDLRGARLNLTIPRSRAPERPGGFTQETTPMPALVVHASKDSKSQRTLYINPALAVAKARGLSRRGWHVHVVDADGRMFYQEQFDELLQAGLKPAARP
jgi:hypothetical protein